MLIGFVDREPLSLPGLHVLHPDIEITVARPIGSISHPIAVEATVPDPW